VLATLPSVTALSPLYSTDGEWHPFHLQRRSQESTRHEPHAAVRFELDRTVGDSEQCPFGETRATDLALQTHQPPLRRAASISRSRLFTSETRA
jgi:hypothetical protein